MYRSRWPTPHRGATGTEIDLGQEITHLAGSITSVLTRRAQRLEALYPQPSPNRCRAARTCGHFQPSAPSPCALDPDRLMGADRPSARSRSHERPVFPRPNCPAVLLPQHFTEPLSRRAHECRPPATIAVAVCPVPSWTRCRLAPISPGLSRAEWCRRPRAAPAVRPPTGHRCVIQERTRVRKPGRYPGGRTAGTHVDDRQLLAHLAGVVAAPYRVTQAQLAVRIASPALHLCIVKDGATVLRAGGDGGCRSADPRSTTESSSPISSGLSPRFSESPSPSWPSLL